MNQQLYVYKRPILMKTHLTIRTVLGIAILLFFHQGHAQQVQLRGTVAVHNSKYGTTHPSCEYKTMFCTN